MTAASIIQVPFAGDGTQLTFLQNLSSAMSTAGFSVYLTSGASPTLSYSWVFNTQSAYTYENLYIQAAFTAASTFTCTGFSGFSGSNGQNASTTVPSTTLTLTSNFNLFSINHPEMRGVILFQNGVNLAFIGYLRPLITPSYWNENSYPWGFIPRSMNPWASNWNAVSSGGLMQPITSLRPNNISATQVLGPLINSSNNAANANSVSIRTPLMVVDTIGSTNYPGPSLNGCFDIGDFSTDLGTGPTVGKNFLDEAISGSTTYQLVDGVTNDKYWSKLYIRTQ